MAVNLINGNDTIITKTDDDIQIDLNSTRTQQLTQMSNDITTLKNAALKKLWENSNPNASFAAQTISFDASDCDYFMVIYKNSAGGTIYNGKIITKNIRFSLDGINAARLFARNSDTNGITNTGVTLSGGMYISNYGTESSNDEYAVPYQIYGGRFGD